MMGKKSGKMGHDQNLEHFWYYNIEVVGILLLPVLQDALLIHYVRFGNKLKQMCKMNPRIFLPSSLLPQEV